MTLRGRLRSAGCGFSRAWLALVCLLPMALPERGAAQRQQLQRGRFNSPGFPGFRSQLPGGGDPNGNRALQGVQQFRSPFSTDPSRIQGFRPVLPGIGGGLPTVPLRTPVRPELLPFLRSQAAKTRQKRGQSTDPSWPSWLQIGGPGHRVQQMGDAKAGPKPSHCFLVRLSETVEVRPANETAFYPLAFWDSSRVLSPGARLRIAGQGRVLLVFPGGTRIDLSGEASVGFLEGTKQRLRVAISKVSRGEVRLGSRRVELELPDGTTVAGSDTILSIRGLRRDAGWSEDGLEHRIELANFGEKNLEIEPRSAAVGLQPYVLRPNRLSVVAFAPGSKVAEEEFGDTPAKTLPEDNSARPELQASQRAQLEKIGESVRIDARNGEALVQWGGFRCRLPDGRRVVLDPLLGSPFYGRRPTSSDSSQVKPDSNR